MSKKLRDAYDTIAADYLSKKQPPWQDFLDFLDVVDIHNRNTVIDVGAGNGRNLLGIEADLSIALDLSIELLHGYIGPNQGQKIAGALPHLPFRKNSTELVLSIAVIHHIKSEQQVIASLGELKRIGHPSGATIISVWRRWRRGHRKYLFEAIRKGEELDPLINHQRPWYNSEREMQAIRFYHYYTYRELDGRVQQSGFVIETSKYLGGRYDDANIFALLRQQKQRE